MLIKHHNCFQLPPGLAGPRQQAPPLATDLCCRVRRAAGRRGCWKRGQVPGRVTACGALVSGGRTASRTHLAGAAAPAATGARKFAAGCHPASPTGLPDPRGLAWQAAERQLPAGSSAPAAACRDWAVEVASISLFYDLYASGGAQREGARWGEERRKALFGLPHGSNSEI